jgi:class 3 adenylate cyclase
MPLASDLKEYVRETFKAQWETRSGQVIPDPEDLTLSNVAVEFKRATVLYADLSGSTEMVERHTWAFAAEIYKNFLYCAARLISNEGGEVTAYDGDRVMAVFIGSTQSTNATVCALKINWATKNIVNPAIKAQYSTSNFDLRHAVGIDTSEIRAARTGVRGANDLVWVGRAANFAAKLTECNADFPTWITAAVYGQIMDKAKIATDGSGDMWRKHTWNAMGGIEIFGSNYWWSLQ